MIMARLRRDANLFHVDSILPACMIAKKSSSLGGYRFPDNCRCKSSGVERTWNKYPINVRCCNMACAQGSSVIHGYAKCVVLGCGKSTYVAGLAAALPVGRKFNAFDAAIRRVVYLFIVFILVMVRL